MKLRARHFVMAWSTLDSWLHWPCVISCHLVTSRTSRLTQPPCWMARLDKFSQNGTKWLLSVKPNAIMTLGVPVFKTLLTLIREVKCTTSYKYAVWMLNFRTLSFRIFSQFVKSDTGYFCRLVVYISHKLWFLYKYKKKTWRKLAICNIMLSERL